MDKVKKTLEDAMKAFDKLDPKGVEDFMAEFDDEAEGMLGIVEHLIQRAKSA